VVRSSSFCRGGSVVFRPSREGVFSLSLLIAAIGFVFNVLLLCFGSDRACCVRQWNFVVVFSDF